MAQNSDLISTVRNLSKLLDKEKSQILSGRYFDHGDLLPIKDTLSQKLEALLKDPLVAGQIVKMKRQLKTVAQKARENESLLEAAKTGAISARTRLTDIRNKNRKVGVYGMDGSQVLMPNASTSKKKLA